MSAATLSALLVGVVLGALALALALTWPSWRAEYRYWREARRNDRRARRG